MQTLPNINMGHGGWRGLVEWDKTWTQRLALCAGTEAPLGNLRPIMKLIEVTCHGVPWLLGIIVALFMSHTVYWHEKLANLFLALLVDLVVTGLLKAVVRRPRPPHNNMDMFATISVDRFSFPSGHTTRAALVAIFFAQHFYQDRFYVACLGVWAMVVASSRVMLGRHHVVDVLSGLAIGVFEYRLVQMLWLPPDLCEELLRPIQEELHL